MLRFADIIARLIEELGRYPLDDGLAAYRDIEFPRELSWTESPWTQARPPALGREVDPQRLAS